MGVDISRRPAGECAWPDGEYSGDQVADNNARDHHDDSEASGRVDHNNFDDRSSQEVNHHRGHQGQEHLDIARLSAVAYVDRDPSEADPDGYDVNNLPTNTNDEFTSSHHNEATGYDDNSTAHHNHYDIPANNNDNDNRAADDNDNDNRAANDNINHRATNSNDDVALPWFVING